MLLLRSALILRSTFTLYAYYERAIICAFELGMTLRVYNACIHHTCNYIVYMYVCPIPKLDSRGGVKSIKEETLDGVLHQGTQIEVTCVRETTMIIVYYYYYV